MKTKKVISLLMAALLSVSIFGGCGDKKDAAESNGKIQITIDNWPNEEASPKAYANAMRKKTEFEAKYPDIEITGESWAYDVKSFMARAEGGTLPTLYQAPFTEAKKLIQFDYAADITEYAKEYGYYGKINETMLDKISENGNIYLMPKSAYTLGIVINLII